MWGPRDIVIDSAGQILVTDTGNKRVVIFDAQGNFLGQFGSPGMGPGQFDEPVGLAVDIENDLLYVADTWNQRIQVFQLGAPGSYVYLREWEFIGWYGQSLENKPFMTVLGNGSLAVADPEAGRIIVFDQMGNYLYAFGDTIEMELIGVVGGLCAGEGNSIWVTDSQRNLLNHFVLLVGED
jgi:DNA-binding beta-propeller fold protein YncE